MVGLIKHVSSIELFRGSRIQFAMQALYPHDTFICTQIEARTTGTRQYDFLHVYIHVHEHKYTVVHAKM